MVSFINGSGELALRGANPEALFGGDEGPSVYHFNFYRAAREIIRVQFLKEKCSNHNRKMSENIASSQSVEVVCPSSCSSERCVGNSLLRVEMKMLGKQSV